MLGEILFDFAARTTSKRSSAHSAWPSLKGKVRRSRAQINAAFHKFAGLMPRERIAERGPEESHHTISHTKVDGFYGIS